MWGIIPAAGAGARIQPLAFSKELLPVGTRVDAAGEHPKAVSEYLVERLIVAGVRKICVIVAPSKWDIASYYGASVGDARLCYVVQQRPAGLCDAIFCAAPFIGDDEYALIGLPDTVWFPIDGLALLKGELSFLLFEVEKPGLFDAVVTDDRGRVSQIQVKDPRAATHWVWGAIRVHGRVLRELYELWLTRDPRDPYLGTLVNEYIARGGEAFALKAGRSYVDVGTVDGYRRALEALTLCRGEAGR